MPGNFDPSFQNPNWAWWIVLYFFLGGITGGIAFAAAWLDLFGDTYDRPAVRLGHLLAFPLILLSAVFLVVDLGQPLRFWHMIFESERFPLPILKPYSPMSLGSLILFIFGVVAFLSFVDELLGRGRWFHGGPIGKVLSVLGALAGLALAGYTGLLVNATNLPVWANSPWISALFLVSGVSTGIALLLLLTRRAPVTTLEKLEDADNYMMVLELIALAVFLITLGAVGMRFVLSGPVAILFGLVIVVGLLIPLLLHLRPGLVGGLRSTASLSSVLVLLGGFLLRWAVLASPQGIGL
jgi:formate-dependent nitrite reductase membrane component NrfD